tara:strand:+ start:15063 stop:15386 length:324 start_codon:yes stop_codon:yes gene_type:complete
VVRVLSLFLLIGASSGWASQDPTAPLNWKKTEPEKVEKARVVYPLPTLQSIVCRENAECKAILSGKVVDVGQRINGYLVKKIESERVVLSRGGRQWKLELFSLDIKQ